MVDGSRAAAISPQQPGDPSPPHWNNYVTVASADETAGKATGAGGTALAEPFDVMELGRMAVLQDPAAGRLLHLGAEGEQRRRGRQRGRRVHLERARHP